MKISVTGGAGVLGQSLIKRLVKNGYQVTSLDLTKMLDIKNCTQIIGDIRDKNIVKKAIANADIVIHAAAALPSYHPKDIRSISVDGTEVVINECYLAKIDRVIHISSSAVYGLPDIVPTPDDFTRQRVDPYNCAKIDAEIICEKYRAKGICLPILRPKTFLGPQRLGIFSMLFDWADEGRNFPLIGGGKFRNQMLDVEDFIDAIISTIVLPSQQVNEAFNIAAVNFTTLHDDFQAVLDLAGHGKKIVSLPATPTIEVLKIFNKLKLSPVYKRLIYKLSKDAYVSTKKAQGILGFQPKYSSQDAIIRAYQWWQESKNIESTKQFQPGLTSGKPWKQGVLRLAKGLF